MKVMGLPETLSEKVDYLIQSIVVCDAARGSLSREDGAKWDGVIDQVLAEWGRNPQQLEDEGVHAPSARTIQLASSVAAVLRDKGVEPPGTVIPNGVGGIVFRWRSGAFTWTMEMEADGSIETSLMDQGKLVCRHSLHGEGV